jgi:hypothetical protein
MIPISEEILQERRRQDFVEGGEKRRLQKQDAGLPVSPARTHHIMLARLGDLLYEAGCSLRRRYAGSRFESSRFGQSVRPASTLGVTAYRGFGGGYQSKPLASETGRNSTPCSGS